MGEKLKSVRTKSYPVGTLYNDVSRRPMPAATVVHPLRMFAGMT